MHVWGTPVYIGMGLIKLCTHKDEGMKLFSVIDTVQLEWSLKLSEFLLLGLKYVGVCASRECFRGCFTHKCRNGGNR